MEGLLFALHPIWWIPPSSWIPLSIVIIGGLFLFAFYRFSLRQTRGEDHDTSEISTTIAPPEYHPIDTRDPQYREKTLREIRIFLAVLYHQHTLSHTPSEISRYCQDTELIRIIKELESLEYSISDTPIERIIEIDRQIQQVIVHQLSYPHIPGSHSL